MNILKKMSYTFSSRALLVVLTGIIVVHLGVMVFSLQDTQAVRKAARRDEIVQKIINAIYLVEATPIANRQHAVSAMADPALHVSLSSAPQWPLQFKTISFWEISRALRNNLSAFSVSIKMGNAQWLNLKATVYSHVVITQFIFMGIEFFVFGAILLTAWTIMRFTEPLKHFKAAAERLGLDLRSEPVDIQGPTVVREAAQAMNRMQERIQTLIRDRTQMLAAISHDLRTPITRMKIRSQFVNDLSLTDSFTRDLDDMDKMITEILAFAREDSTSEAPVRFDLVSLIESICDDAHDMGHQVVFESEQHRVPFLGRALALKRAITNIIHNAIRYGHHVRVSLSQGSKHVVIHVEDDGPGISEKDLKSVFEPFYRGEHSRSRDTGGTGLGLAVTRDIVQSHGGRIVLKNKSPHGLLVSVELTWHRE